MTIWSLAVLGSPDSFPSFLCNCNTCCATFSFTLNNGNVRGLIFCLLVAWCLSVSRRRRVVLFHLPSAELRKMEPLLLSLSSLTVVWMPFRSHRRAVLGNTHDRGFIQNTTPPHTQYDSQSWADCPGSLVFLRWQHKVGEVLAKKMLLDLHCRAVNIKHYF